MIYVYICMYIYIYIYHIHDISIYDQIYMYIARTCDIYIIYIYIIYMKYINNTYTYDIYIHDVYISYVRSYVRIHICGMTYSYVTWHTVRSRSAIAASCCCTALVCVCATHVCVRDTT